MIAATNGTNIIVAKAMMRHVSLGRCSNESDACSTACSIDTTDYNVFLRAIAVNTGPGSLSGYAG